MIRPPFKRILIQYSDFKCSSRHPPSNRPPDTNKYKLYVKTFYASLIIVKAIFFCLTLWVGWSSCSNVGQTWEIVSPSAQCVIASIIGNWEKFHNCAIAIESREGWIFQVATWVISLSHSTAFKVDKKRERCLRGKVVIHNSSRVLDCLSSQVESLNWLSCAQTWEEELNQSDNVKSLTRQGHAPSPHWTGRRVEK